MSKPNALRRSLVPLALAALLLAGPQVSHAIAGPADPVTATQPDNGWLAVGCGLLVRSLVICPHPVGISVTILVCALMVVDAITTPDRPPGM